jgi:prephenate dehydrogenase
MKFGVVGLGLMGGSFAIAIKNMPICESCVGFDLNEIHNREAIELGIVDRLVSFEEIFDVDFLVLAVPVDAIKSILKNIKNINPTLTIVDFGSTKYDIVKSIPEDIRKQVVASHPMTGTEFSGPRSAFATLYRNKIMVICNKDESGDIHLQKALEVFGMLEMKIIQMDAMEHDRHASFISHLPHIISYSLANTVLEQEDKDSILALAAGGFRDMSRLAKSSPSMWESIFRQNRENLLNSIDIFERHLITTKENIKNNNWQEISEWMEEANRLHKII